MINIHNNSNTVIIIVHEIYGINNHMINICQSLSQKNFDVICPNLLDDEAPFEYSQEELAYRNFIENIGFMNASNQIKNVLLHIKDNYEKVYIVGFSVGATIAWLCSEEDGLDGIVGYYGSQIRNYLGIEPLCPTMLLFPEEEKSFNVDGLIISLEKKNIEVHKFNGQHGFCDPYSQKYNIKSAQKAFNRMVEFFLKH
ncbi:Dienelactone hydrolase [Fictibacillus solisalsi]|uniref:Dienelactone hydrolase n=1 Tax=Fictibacillus solisalsi TaxID=459525 RepID=A0A1G9VKG6_9BACL|nr:dienelactone hydrolase family protein [Fictibacillus solisalsi]SDM72315.1 Dienelactone hydrolase [Fictibacillus solisalsi]